jgi:ABC-2 type transport system permease protein
MNRTWLIARQEFIKYITRRGFIISLLIFPMWIVLGIVVPKWMSSTVPPRPFVIVDHTDGSYAQALRDTLARSAAGRQLQALADYANANADMKAFARAEPNLAAMLAAPNAESSRQTFHDTGIAKTLATLAPYQRANAPPFDAPPPRFVLLKTPTSLANIDPQLLPKLAGRYLTGEEHSGLPVQVEKLYAVVVIPKDFGANGNTAQYYSTDTSASDLSDGLQQALTSALRLHAAHALVPHGTEGASALDVSADLRGSDPTRSSDQREAAVEFIANYLPVALAILLFIVSMMNASVLLQGVIEEKSSRMIEVLLSCATPRQILTGKLVGVVAVSLVTLVAWGIMLLGIALIASDNALATASAGVSAVLGFNMLPLVVVYFLCQILIYGAIFLGIGSMANSLADAQALLGPAMIVLILPNLLIGGILQDPSGDVARFVSWIPIYTPFLMLVRLSSHPPALELWTTALLSIATTIALILFVSRIFAKHILTTERPPAFAALVKRVFGRT